MTEDNGTNNWRGITWLKGLAAVGFGAAFVVAFLLIGHTHWHRDAGGRLLEGFLAGALAILAAFVVGTVWFSRHGLSTGQQLVAEVANAVEGRMSVTDQGLRALQVDLNLVSWSELFQGTKTIVIIDRYFDGWAEICFPLLVSFFKGGGTADIYLSHPTFDRVITTTAEQHFPPGEVSRKDMSRRALESVEKLDSACREADSPEDRITVRYVKEVVNYAAIAFDNDALVLKPYELFFRAIGRSPVTVWDTHAAPQIAGFWTHERDHLDQSDKCVPVSIHDVLTELRELRRGENHQP